MKLERKKRGFTLIELLVVVAIIGILSSVVLAYLDSANEKAKISRAKSEMSQIRIAMQLFLIDKEELPPIGDNCSACANPCSASWTTVMDALVSGGYFSTRIDMDPWGHYYCYDDNYRVISCTYDTPLWSMGPNGRRDTRWGNGPPVTFSGDDFGIIIKPPQC